MKTKEVTDSRKSTLGRSDALKLAKAATRVIAARGKKVVRIDIKKDKPTDEDLLAVMLGPTGNLRAPTVRKGKTVVVGFNDDVYQELFS